MTQSVLLIGEDGQKIGNVSFAEAKEIAESKNKDLVLVNKDKSVYKIADRGKLKYERKQKERKLRAQRRAQKIKEIQMRPTIGDADLDVKLRHVREFLSDGLKTKIVMKFKGQQMSYVSTGLSKMKNIVEIFVSEGLATADPPRLEGRRITAFLTPKV